MTTTVKLRKIGNSLGLILPKEIAEQPRLGEGDALPVTPDADAPPRLAGREAAHGLALARGHCFPDGNKRVALAIIDVFLRLNGFELTAVEEDAASTIQGLASGERTEDAVAEWIASNSQPH